MKRSLLYARHLVFRPQLTVLLLLSLLAIAPVFAAAAVKSPLAPVESLQELVAAPGCVVELAAAEPAVVDCVACRFDEHGRMWVVEMRDYPYGPQPGDPPRSRIRILQDKDHDGRFESATTFADGLLFATGLQLWRDGAFVTHAGKISLLRDTDGDLRADETETWFTGFAEENTQLRANHPTLAPDGWIYVANGLRGGVVQGKRKNDKPLAIRGKDFRFHPVTRDYQAVSGNGQFGLSIDTFGNRFLCTNRNPLKHVVIEDRHLTGPAAGLISAAVTDIAAAGAESSVFSITNAWTTSNLHAGQFTAACGVHRFGGNALPASFVGNAFTCDPTGSLVHREVLTRAGPTFVSQPARASVEFLASRDSWFRPVNLTTGPDGALYVVDMYRAVIEHPQWMPVELRKRPDLLWGNDRGRIYRIAGKASVDTSREVLPGSMETMELATQLEHKNAWHQFTAFRLLLQSDDNTIAASLKTWWETKRDATEISSGLIAPLLDRVGLLASRDLLMLAAKSPRAEIRRQAIQLIEPRCSKSPELRTAVTELLKTESDAGVAFQILLTLAPLQENESELLRQAMSLPTGNRLKHEQASVVAARWFGESVLLAGQAIALTGLEIGLGDSETRSDNQSARLMERFATLAGRNTKTNDQRLAVLKTIFHGQNAEGVDAALLAVAKVWRGRLPDLPATESALINRRIQSAVAEASQQSLAPAVRVRAVELLALSQRNLDTLIVLATESDSQAVRLQAINALAGIGDVAAWQPIAASFESATPALRAEMVRGLASRDTLAPLLLDLMESKDVRPAELDQATRLRLQQLSNPVLKERAARLLVTANPSERVKALADYQSSLQLKGDPVAGAKWFGKTCATCHRIGENGVNVAPDISDSRTKTAAQLLGDIVQPNRAIDANYVGYLVETIDGKTLAGIITEETAAAVVLKMPGAKIATIERTKIERLASTGVSLMPEGLERDLSKQQMADLLAYIKNWRYLDDSSPPINANE